MTTKLSPDEIEEAIWEAHEGRPRLFISRFLSVRDKQNDLVPFEFANVIRQINAANAHYRFILKPRQAWVTTYLLAELYAYCSTIPFFQAAIVEHEKDAAERVFMRVHQYHDYMPEGMAPRLDTSRNDYIHFADMESSLYVGTAGGRKFGRSETINALVLDEFGHYTPAQAEEIWTGAPESVPQGGFITIASTPNGIGNRFHTGYNDALAGMNQYRAFSFRWFDHEEFRLGPDDPETRPADRMTPLELTGEELELVEKHALTESQIRWRRSKKAAKGNEFPQEYPEDDVTCFLATQNSVFPMEVLREMLLRAPEPVEVY
jgi:hypothetical protein